MRDIIHHLQGAVRRTGQLTPQGRVLQATGTIIKASVQDVKIDAIKAFLRQAPAEQCTYDQTLAQLEAIV